MKKQCVVNLGYRSELPEKIKPISEKWTRLANARRDIGSCVLGAGFEFDLDGRRYFLPPMSIWQGSCTWEADVEEIRADLLAAGCLNLVYHWGTMD